MGHREGALRTFDSEPRAIVELSCVLHAPLHSHRNDEWAGNRKDDTGDTPDFLERVERAYLRAVLKRFNLGAPFFPYKVETDLSKRTDWLTTQYFDTTEEEQANFPWTTVSQDMSLRYLGKWDVGDDGSFTDEMFSQFYMAGSVPVALAQL
jgi:hypothetical protein